MNIAKDARFWDQASQKYSRAVIADQGGYERTIERTRALLGAEDRVLELGCGTGTTAMRLSVGVARYLATDISRGMISIAAEKLLASPNPVLAFQTATVETIDPAETRFDAVLGFNYLHLVVDVEGTLKRIHELLMPGGLFISKTACLGDMNPLIRLVLLPAMRLVGKAPSVSVFKAVELERMIIAAGFDIVATERHATRGRDTRPYIVARKR